MPQKREIYLGKDSQGNAVYFDREYRRSHTHILGGSGTGKSKLLELLIQQDMQWKNAGLCLIDPHGELYDNILAYASRMKSLAKRVVLFHPDNIESEYFIGLNPFPRSVEDPQTITRIFSEACMKAWKQNMNEYPRISTWLNNLFYVLIENNLTLLEAIPFLDPRGHDSKIERHAMFHRVAERNRLVYSDWEAFNGTSPQRRAELIEGVANRLRPFLSQTVLQQMFSSTKYALNFEQLMEDGKIVLINLHNKNGSFTTEDANLIGTMILNEIYRVGKRRDTSNSQLKPFRVYVDEFQNFLTRDIARSLDELRKYRIFFTLSHQHLEQLAEEDEYIYASVMTNCRNKVVFSLSANDAEIMQKELFTGFHDLLKIKYQHEVRINEPYFDDTPVEQEVRRQSEATSMIDESSEVKREGKGTQESKIVSESESEAHSQDRAENKIYQVVEVIKNSTGETNIDAKTQVITEAVIEALSERKGREKAKSQSAIERHSKSTTNRQDTIEQIAKVFAQTHSDASSQSITQQLADILAENETKTATHSVAHAVADILTKTNTHSDVESLFQQVSKIIAESESKRQSESYLRSQSTNERRSNTQQENRQTSNEHRTVNTQGEEISSARMNESGSRTGKSKRESESRGRTSVDEKKEIHNPDGFSKFQFKGEGLRTSHSNDRGAFEESFDRFSNQETQRQISSRSDQVAKVISDSVSKIVAQIQEQTASITRQKSSISEHLRSQTHQSTDGKTTTQSRTFAESIGKQESDLVNDVVAHSNQHSYTQQNSEIKANVTSQSDTQVTTDQNSKTTITALSEAIADIMETHESDMVREIFATAINNTKQKSTNNSITHTVNSCTSEEHANQKVDTLSEIMGKSFNRTKARTEQTSSTNFSNESEERGNRSATQTTKNETIDYITTSTRQQFMRQVIEKQKPDFWTLQDLEYFRQADLKLQDSGIATFKFWHNEPIRVKIAHVPEIKRHKRYKITETALDRLNGHLPDTTVTELAFFQGRIFPNEDSLKRALARKLGNNFLYEYGEIILHHTRQPTHLDTKIAEFVSDVYKQHPYYYVPHDQLYQEIYDRQKPFFVHPFIPQQRIKRINEEVVSMKIVEEAEVPDHQSETDTHKPSIDDFLND